MGGPLRINRLVVTIDSEESASRALPHALWLADALSAQIELLAVAESAARGASLERMLLTASTEVTSHLGEARVAYDFATIDRIVTACEPPDVMACMATDWRARRSVARRVTTRSIGPVLLVGPGAEPMPSGRGLLAFVAGPARDRVLAVARTWSSALDIAMTVVAVDADGTRTKTSVPSLRSFPLDGRDPATALLDFERDHPARVLALGVPPPPFRWLRREGRLLGRVIRSGRIPVLAITER